MIDVRIELFLELCAIRENWWKQRLPVLREMKLKILQEYSFEKTIAQLTCAT